MISFKVKKKSIAFERIHSSIKSKATCWQYNNHNYYNIIYIRLKFYQMLFIYLVLEITLKKSLNWVKASLHWVSFKLLRRKNQRISNIYKLEGTSPQKSTNLVVPGDFVLRARFFLKFDYGNLFGLSWILEERTFS